jgi:NAD(P)H-dependent FMN reductase
MKALIFALCQVATTLSLSAEEMKVLAFAGSTRQDSYNKKLVNEAAEIARSMGATVTVIDLKDYPMPFYDGDVEAEEGMPENAKKFRNLMLSHDRVIISTPEYNGSIPAILKNALDWASRTEDAKRSKDAFKGKFFALMSTSPSKRGGADGVMHLRFIVEDLGGKVVAEPVSIGNAASYFQDPGRTSNEALKEEIAKLTVAGSA